jgi:hypothetical protein
MVVGLVYFDLAFGDRCYWLCESRQLYLYNSNGDKTGYARAFLYHIMGWNGMDCL